MKRCLVTGGAGFIGSHLVEGLLDKGCFVRVLDNFSFGHEAYLPVRHPSLEVVHGDVRDRTAVKAVLEGVDTVFHQAALASVPASIDDPWETHDVNVNGTLHLLRACVDAGVKKVVVAASSAAYGDDPRTPKVESMAVHPLSPYAVSKLAQEQYATAFCASYGLETVSLRYFNVYGPRQGADSQYAAVIPSFFSRALGGKACEIYGDGSQTRDFVFVHDVVRANILAAQTPKTQGAVINIAGGQGVSISQLEAEIRKLSGSRAEVIRHPARVGDILHSVADISKAAARIGWRPHVPFEEGLRLSLAWYRQA